MVVEASVEVELTGEVDVTAATVVGVVGGVGVVDVGATWV